jgi:hypothetical protein
MAAKPKLRTPSTKSAAPATPLLRDVRELIPAARDQVARAVGAALVTLYWHERRRIHQEILKKKRAEYETKIVPAMGRQLSGESGRGFIKRNPSF